MSILKRKKKIDSNGGNINVRAKGADFQNWQEFQLLARARDNRRSGSQEILEFIDLYVNDEGFRELFRQRRQGQNISYTAHGG